MVILLSGFYEEGNSSLEKLDHMLKARVLLKREKIQSLSLLSGMYTTFIYYIR